MNIRRNHSWRSQLGLRYETLALRYLRRHRLKLVHSNYRCQVGELDLVMRDGDMLVFVEVRYRKHTDFGGALGSVTADKQRRLARTAQHYLLAHPGWQTLGCRFDVVCVSPGANGKPDIMWVRDAFRPTA